MPRLTTETAIPAAPFLFEAGSRTLVLGSCFADSVGEKMAAGGMDVLVNPFGTLYNPVSIANAIGRLDSGDPFTEQDCVEMGSGAGLICSFSHHTRFARPVAESFLENANRELEAACRFWKGCDRVVITFGTARTWTLRKDGSTVANCLKRPAAEFRRETLSIAEVRDIARAMVLDHPDKKFLFTVSPIRHLSDGAHANNVSKATLLLGIDEALEGLDSAAYFPSYEIVLDELRDYRFYSEDLCHPSPTAVEIIWEKFLGSYVPAGDVPAIREKEKAARRAAHRSMR